MLNLIETFVVFVIFNKICLDSYHTCILLLYTYIHNLIWGISILFNKLFCNHKKHNVKLKRAHLTIQTINYCLFNLTKYLLKIQQ